MFIGKAVRDVSTRVEELTSDLSNELKETSSQVNALAIMGMVAFSLISLVAVTALIIASSKE